MKPKIKPVSKGNHYNCSDGRTVSKTYVNRMVTKAKRQVLADQLETLGYHKCQECGINGGTPLDCAHTVSVDEAQKSGRTELSWAPQNIKILCRHCHNIYDKRNIGGAR